MEHKGSIITLDSTDGSVNTPSRRRLFLLTLGVAVLLLVAAVVYLSLPAVESNPASELTGEITADSARWAAIGDFYAAKAADVERGAAADAARWDAMGEHYTAEATDIARGAAADTARWDAMGEHYTANGSNVDASVARWEAMGEHYAVKETSKLSLEDR